MRKFVGVGILFFTIFAIATAEEFTAIVSKFEDGKITFKKFKKGEKSEATTLAVAADCKYIKGKFNKEEKKTEADGPLEGGKEALEKRVKEAAAKKPDETKKFNITGVIATLVTEGEGDKAKVTEIRVAPAFNFKKKDANQN